MPRLLALIAAALLLLPHAAAAQELDPSVIDVPDTLFRARVTQVLEERVEEQPDGTESLVQKLELELLEGPFVGRRVTFDGTVIDAIAKSRYREGDKVIAWWSKDPDGTDVFWVTDYVRDDRLLWMALLFVAAVVVVGRWRGVRALVALGLSVAALFMVILPALLKGADPLLVTVPVAIGAVAVGILLTHGTGRQSLVAIAGVAVSLALTGALAWLFSAWARITGFGTEEAAILSQLVPERLNMAGLFLAGTIVGTIGVLDDVVISQAAVVEELVDANPGLSRGELFRRAMRVGTDHTAAVVNTLFLAYAGASLPLLLLFSIQQPPFLTFRDVVNNELVASEIVRTLVGSIGLVLTVPITTALAVRFLKR